MTRKAPYRVSSVDNALLILRLFKENQPVRVSDAASRIGAAPSTAHRLLASLERHGFVRRDPTTRTYFPGSALTELGAATASRELASLAGPALRRLCEHLEESVHLTTLQGTSVVFLDSVETSRGLRIGSRAGAVMPAHCTSAGKAMLAQLDDEELAVLYSEPDSLRRVTDRSMTTFSDLHADLALTRERGYATNFEESEVGVSAVAVALPPGPDRVPAAISVSVPSVRFSDGSVDDIQRVLTKEIATIPSRHDRHSAQERTGQWQSQ